MGGLKHYLNLATTYLSNDIFSFVTYISNACNLREEDTVGKPEGVTVALAVGVGDHLGQKCTIM